MNRDKVTSFGSGSLFLIIAGALAWAFAYLLPEKGSHVSTLRILILMVVILAALFCIGGAVTFFSWAFGYPKRLFEESHPEAPMKIAVVEDDVSFAQAIEELLKNAGHEVLLISKNFDRESIESIRRFSPDLTLLDHTLNAYNTGEDIAQMLGYPRKKLFSISSQERTYCAKQYKLKERLLHSKKAQEEFLLMLR